MCPRLILYTGGGVGGARLRLVGYWIAIFYGWPNYVSHSKQQYMLLQEVSSLCAVKGRRGLAIRPTRGQVEGG